MKHKHNMILVKPGGWELKIVTTPAGEGSPTKIYMPHKDVFRCECGYEIQEWPPEGSQRSKF